MDSLMEVLRLIATWKQTTSYTTHRFVLQHDALTTHARQQRVVDKGQSFFKVPVDVVLVIQHEMNHPRYQIRVDVDEVLPVREIGLVEVPHCPRGQPATRLQQ
jgi:hypothetical protein